MSSTPKESDAFDTGLRPQDVDPERPEPLETPWGTFALFQVGEKIHCVEAFCPHMLGPLFAGSVSHGQVTCPWHLWRYDLASGERVDGGKPAEGEGPADRERLAEGEGQAAGGIGNQGLADGCESRPLERCRVELGPRGTLILTRA